MDIDTGCSLATHINDHSTRYSATVLDFGLQAWVIIRDHEVRHKPTYAEPIADVADFLARAERATPPVEREYLNLLLSWLELSAREPLRSPETARTSS